MAEIAVPSLTQALTDNDTNVREIAAQVLGEYRKTASSSAPALLKCVGDTNKTLRGLAAWALVQTDLQIAKQSPLVIRALIENLQHETWWLPKFCAQALKQLDADAAAKAEIK